MTLCLRFTIAMKSVPRCLLVWRKRLDLPLKMVGAQITMSCGFQGMLRRDLAGRLRTAGRLNLARVV